MTKLMKRRYEICCIAPHKLHLPHTYTHFTCLTPLTPHSFVLRNNREQGVAREKQLPQKLQRLLPMAITKRLQDLRKRPHTVPGGLRKNLTPSHRQWCMCTRGATGRPNCEETGGVCQISSDFVLLIFVCVHSVICCTLGIYIHY